MAHLDFTSVPGMPDPGDHLAELRAEHRRLIGSMEYAYAMGAQRSHGPRDPRLESVVARVEELERRIAAAGRE
jgi:hypothetical protein